ncbi:hypothetical protein ABZP36_028759 [Zizania latifolia]
MFVGGAQITGESRDPFLITRARCPPTFHPPPAVASPRTSSSSRPKSLVRAVAHHHARCATTSAGGLGNGHWYAWLCKAGPQPDVAFEYTRNGLGVADLRHLNHDFLATMGVAIAKHRLGILKLAKRETSSSVAILQWRATRVLGAAVHRSALLLPSRKFIPK